MDISSVFPSAAGIKASRKLSQREQAGTQVKGLAAFDAQHWQLSFSPQSLDKSAMLDMMRDDLLRRDLSRLNQSIEETFSSEWWSNLKSASKVFTAPLASREARLATKKDEQSRREDGDEVEDSGFQRQSTPPGLKKRHANEHLGLSSAKGPDTHDEADDKDETTDDDDLDAQPPRTVEREQPPETKDGVKKPWTIGGSKFTALPQKDQRNAQSLVADPFETEDHSTTDEDDEHASVPIATPPPIITDDKGSPQKAKLGHIGGQKKVAGVSSRAAPKTASASVDGTLDRRDGQSAPARGTARSKSPQLPSSPMSTDIGDATEQTRPPSTSEPSDKPPESSQERADRKRAELKRQLEAKAAAPGKKKRRF
ncbi:hypothetical protein H2199_007991 [Coniosporium tulheliwenetii]|uniref:Uncharacterized protein n=1 Tax=Coniosporium tulheliwenetii TaxID=3383036 RepID=A0ACC2YM06_9PEZI|nr:hypothetical protein H2199_007991 [Cladosporium sp. JES 115]